MPTVLALHLGGSTVHAAVAIGGRIDVLALDDQSMHLPAPALTDGPGLVRVLATAQARCLQVVDAVQRHFGNEGFQAGCGGADELQPVGVQQFIHQFFTATIFDEVQHFGG